MNNNGTAYALEPTTFHSMQQAQEPTNTLEENLHNQHLGTANVRPGLVEISSELVNNAAEHGVSPAGADIHVRYMPHRRANAFDIVVADQGPGIRTTLSANPDLTQPKTDAEAIGLAVQELVSGTGASTRASASG